MRDFNSQDLLALYQAGEDAAATELFDRYAARLLGLVRTRLGAKLRRRVDSDDIVQSAFRSFFLQARNPALVLHEPGQLWRMLAAFTLHKLHGQIERHTAAKRNVLREEPADLPLSRSAAEGPSIAEAIAVAEQFWLVANSLSPQEKAVLAGTLQGQSPDEIAESIGKSARTVRRLLAGLERKVEQRLLGDHRSPRRSRTFPEPKTPLQYSDYVLGQLIGAGGMGKVYRATERSTGKTVAIKALRKSRLSDVRALQSFVQEAEVLTGLSHPSIVGVRGLGKFPGGGYFMVMDYIDGADLQMQLAAKEFPLHEAIQIVSQVAAAIQYAHEQGIVHSDLKPANVLVDRQGRVFVTDFGFAVLAGQPTRTQRIGGTLGYLAPEVLEGRSPPTPAADVYALGMILNVLTADARPAEDLHSTEMSPAATHIHAIIRRCTARELSARYQSASELVDALAEVERAF